jgi:hypothetical protein
LWLPAWRVDARLETHWAGLRPALNRTGKKPVAGVDHTQLRYMVPASQGLDQAELAALQPFDEADAQAWDEGEADGDTIWEPPALSRRGAQARARRALIEQHREAIARANGLLTTKVSALVDEQDLRLMLLPVYIGSFRFRDRPWRFVVNAQSGVVVGEAPLDRRKVAVVVLATLALAALLVWLGHARGLV